MIRSLLALLPIICLPSGAFFFVLAEVLSEHQANDTRINTL